MILTCIIASFRLKEFFQPNLNKNFVLLDRFAFSNLQVEAKIQVIVHLTKERIQPITSSYNYKINEALLVWSGVNGVKRWGRSTSFSVSEFYS